MLTVYCLFIYFAISADFLLLTTTAEDISLPTTCADNEQYYNDTFSPLCDTNCQDLERNCRITEEHAVAGCYCRLGFARNLRQKCIPVNDCQADCAPNEQPIKRLQRNCENFCPASEQVVRTGICYTNNERNCICFTNYCRNSRGECEKYQSI